MIKTPVPSNEAQRLQALRELLILDTPPEQRFDRIVAFARQEFEVQGALINLIDAQRQWTKAVSGGQALDLPREQSFCAHAICQPQTLLIEDTLQDPRFATHPLVLGPPFIRFYAGAPLEMQPGLRVGTLCLHDSQPRHFDATDLAILGTLRDLVVGELQGRSVEAAP